MTNALTFELNKTAQWRARMAERHAEDWRNQDAVKRLNDLAEQKPVGELHVFSVLDDMETDVDSPYYDQLSDARSEVLRSIGFWFQPENVTEVAIAIVRSLRDYPSIEDVARINSEHGKADAAASAAGKTVN
jgi:hypothetical protein